MDIATSFYAGFLGLIMLALSFRVVRARKKTGVLIGHGDEKDLKHAMRVQANFIEYVPLGLVLILFVEIADFPLLVVHGLAASLVIARVLHAWGFGKNPGASPGRYWGTLLTWAVILVASVLAIWAGYGVFLPESVMHDTVE
jgi:uncharacterized membrane protein YecN with MAPEG domain